MSHRVIAGSAKGRRLKLVPGNSTRPIMDRAKEALFSILGRTVIQARFLDLFAGTGAVGIEALSRGARYALFIELDKLALKTIKENVAITHLEDKAEIRRMDAFNLLKMPPPAEPFDYIYVAPPQYKNIWLDILKTLDANPGWIAPQTIVIVQIDPKEDQDTNVLKYLHRYDERRYGKTSLFFYHREEHTQEEQVEETSEPDEPT